MKIAPLIVLLVTSLAHANDGALTLGGSPKLMKGHPTVRMQSEVIQVWTDGEKVKVECDFVFVNDGAACTVKMGFPDVGYGDGDPYEDDDGKTPKSVMTRFDSWVNGVKVETAMERVEVAGSPQTWRTKSVSFPAKGTVKVRDVYEQECGGGVMPSAMPMTAKEIGYIVHTGSSWKGKIGRSEIRFTLAGKKSLTLMTLAEVATRDPDGVYNFKKMPKPDIVVWQKRGKPTVKGNVVTWVRTNWRPTGEDDPGLLFDFRGMGG